MPLIATKHRESSLPVVFNFLKDERLTDCCLSAEGSLIRAHKLILAASSKYFEELFALLEEKHPVIVLKDVSIKFLLMILEYIYLGKIEIESEDVLGFKEVAKTLQIKVEFEECPGEEEEEDMSQDLLTEINDEEMQSSLTDHTMDPEDMEFSQSPTQKSSKVTGRKFEDEDKAHNKGPPAKKLKSSSSGLSKARSVPRKLKPFDPMLNPCIYCDRRMREKDRRYHQKFCWENPDRIESNCKYCPKKLQIPGKLRVHMNQCHPEIKF